MSEAGQHLDFLIATKVMGLEAWPGVALAIKAPFVPEWTKPAPCIPPPYSTDIADAWKVVEHLRQAEYLIDIDSLSQSRWCCIINGPEKVMGATLTNHHFVHAETAPLAICLAALEVVENDNSTRN